MSCLKFEGMIVNYLAGELKESEAARLEEHLKACKDCSKTLDEYNSVLTEARELQAPVYGEEFWAAKLNEIKNCHPQRQRRAFIKPVIISSCALVLFAVLSAWIFHGGRNMTARPAVVRNNYAMVLNELPYPEDTLIDMVDYIDDDSATKLLNIIFENNLVSAHIR